jgi:hypothetical protein
VSVSLFSSSASGGMYVACNRKMSDCLAVVPSNMNKVGAEDNMFANLIDKVPAKRVGRTEDLVGAILYLSSQAGVSCFCILTRCVLMVVFVTVLYRRTVLVH